MSLQRKLGLTRLATVVGVLLLAASGYLAWEAYGSASAAWTWLALIGSFVILGAFSMRSLIIQEMREGGHQEEAANDEPMQAPNRTSRHLRAIKAQQGTSNA